MSLFKINFREAFRSLWGARQRSLLALIGIVIGIGSVIGMVSIGTIVQQQVLDQFRDMGIDIVMIRKGMEEGRKAQFSAELLGRLPQVNRSIIAIAPYVNNGTEFTYGRQKFYMEQMGVTAVFFDLNKLRIREGRAISDLDQNRYFCVVGSEFAAFLRSNRGPVLGSQVFVDGRAFTIIGVLDKAAEGGLRPHGHGEGLAPCPFSADQDGHPGLYQQEGRGYAGGGRIG
jgi:putative ABC transport system permease protein